jgi:hypothetical protein
LIFWFHSNTKKNSALNFEMIATCALNDANIEHCDFDQVPVLNFGSEQFSTDV